MSRSASEAARTIALHFDGDVQLYEAFASVCSEQFEQDAAAGDDAVARGDLPTLRRIAHDLKSALRLLGLAEAGALASRIEGLADGGDLEAAADAWGLLCRELPIIR